MNFQKHFFDDLRKLVLEKSGVNLENDRDDLLLSLVEPSLGAWKVASLRDLMALLENDPAGSLAQRVVESLLPKESYFFRDPAFFQVLEKRVLPEMVLRMKAQRAPTFWCAACSTGQEPYSLAMLMKDKFPQLFDQGLRLVASDISQTALEQARSGIYNEVESRRGLPAPYLEQFMEPSGTGYQVKEEIRRMVEFRRINLKEDWLVEKPVDLLLLRNVMIYFDTEMKKNVLARCRESLGNEGILFLGTSETVLFLGGSLASVSYDGQVTGYRVRQTAPEEKPLNLGEIDRFLNEMWVNMTGETPRPAGPKGFPHGIPLVSAYIRILGVRNLMVRLTVTATTAAAVAAHLFGSGEGPVTQELSEDALKEMVNILGGNIKALMSKHHFLSIPSVALKNAESLGRPPGEPLFDRFYGMGNEPFHLAVMDLKGN
jgi:chemotaxis protein methyltransferase CheR